MASRMQQSVDRHFQRLLERSGEAATYSRGQLSAAITAAPGSTAVTVEDAEGVSVRAKRCDWIVKASQLVLDGEQVTPEVGDLIRLADGGQTAVYEVQRLAGDGHYRPCAPGSAYLRIHTRQVDTE